DAGVIVQNVDPAIGHRRLIDQPLDIRILGDVEGATLRPPAGVADASRGLLGALGDEVCGDHDGAFAAHDLRPAATDAGARGGDDGDAILEDHGFLPRLSWALPCAAAAI